MIPTIHSHQIHSHQIHWGSWILLVLILVWIFPKCLLGMELDKGRFSTFLNPYIPYELTQVQQNYHVVTDKSVRIQYVSKRAGIHKIKLERTEVVNGKLTSTIFSSLNKLHQGFHSIKLPLILFNGFHNRYTYSIGLPKFFQVREIAVLDLADEIIHVLYNIPRMDQMELDLDEFSTFSDPYIPYELSKLEEINRYYKDKSVRIQYISERSGIHKIKLNPEPCSTILSSLIELHQGFQSIKLPHTLFSGYPDRYTYSIGLPKFVHVLEIAILDQSNQIIHVLYNRDFWDRVVLFRNYMRWKQSSRPRFKMVVEMGHILKASNENGNGNREFEDRYKPLLDKRTLPSPRELIMERTPENIYDKLYVRFKGDKGDNDDRRFIYEKMFFHLAVKELMDPALELFTVAPGSNNVLIINPESTKWEYFEYLGRLMALALTNCNTLDISIAKPIYKLILNRPLGLDDLKQLDPDTTNEINRFIAHANAFTKGQSMATEQQTIFSDESSAVLHVPVTEEKNVPLANPYILKTRIDTHISAIRRGLFEIIPQQALTVFNTEEFDILVGSLPTIDIQQWKQVTRYVQYSSDDEVVQWFWKCVESWGHEMQSRFMFFTRGSSRIPIGWAFQSEYTFELTGCVGCDGPRPFGYFGLRLPRYESYHVLQSELERVIINNPGF